MSLGLIYVRPLVKYFFIIFKYVTLTGITEDMTFTNELVSFLNKIISFLVDIQVHY